MLTKPYWHRTAVSTTLANIDKIGRYEQFQREVMHRRGFQLNVDTITADDLRDLKRWMQEEHTYGEQFPLFYKDIPESKYKWERSENSITGCFYRIRTVIKWCIKKGMTKNNPFDQYQIAQPMYGDPFFLNIGGA